MCKERRLVIAGEGLNVPLRIICTLIFRWPLMLPFRLICFCSVTRLSSDRLLIEMSGTGNVQYKRNSLLLTAFYKGFGISK